ncbi:MAG: hypothetical protein MJ189_01015 [Coriobacteriales bacterium]|nr:hypothetical protein [Coriobacteriales bacterium]
MKKVDTIYIEKDADHAFLDLFETRHIVEIEHYKDVFCRPHQDWSLQHARQNIILAKKRDKFVYKGARPCQDFAYDNFYYSSCVMNCICSCDYCYLRGMYPSGNLVIFTNLEDYFEHVPTGAYLSISYDTDLFALESTLGYIQKWCDYARTQGSLQNVTLEVRTKCKNLDVFKMEPPSNVIFAFSINPQVIIDKYERGTSSLKARLENIQAAQSAGFRTRLCIDPIIYCNDWQDQYAQLIDSLDLTRFEDISIGSFRISQSYIGAMRASGSVLANFPFKNVDGYMQYSIDMESFVYERVIEKFPAEKVFLWH